MCQHDCFQMHFTVQKIRNEANFYKLNLQFSDFYCWSTWANKHTYKHTECLQVLLAHVFTPPDSSWTECPWLCTLPYGLTGRERDWPPLVGDCRGGSTVNKSLAGSRPSWTHIIVSTEERSNIESYLISSKRVKLWPAGQNLVWVSLPKKGS